MPGDGHVRCGGRARETGREESRHRALVRSHVIVDPIDYQRRQDESGDPPAPLRTLHFGTSAEGLVTFLVYPPDDLVLVVRIQWLGV
jgi:hypothetical protein